MDRRPALACALGVVLLGLVALSGCTSAPTRCACDAADACSAELVAECADASLDAGTAAIDAAIDPAPDCGTRPSIGAGQIECGGEACDVPAETCCWRIGGSCGGISSCVARGAPTADCNRVVECWGDLGQCAAGSWCCSGPDGTRCVSDASACGTVLCSTSAPATCPASRPSCELRSLEGPYECVAGTDAGPADGGSS